MFQNLEQARLKLKAPKCTLLLENQSFCACTYLGHVVSAQGIVTDEDKIDAIRKWPTPPLSLKSKVFWGVHEILLLVHHQICTGSLTPAWTDIWQKCWQEEGSYYLGMAGCQQSFADLKHLCTTAPILAYTDFTTPFKLHTDACGSGLGMSSTRLMMIKLMPSFPIPVGVWQRLGPTTPPIDWSFSPLSGPWLRNSMSIFMHWPLMSIPTTTPRCMF